MRANIAITLVTVTSSLLSAVTPAFSGGGGSLACYQPVHQPALYETRHETVVVSPARTVHDVVPAQYGYEERQVLVEPARVAVEHIPAVTRTVAKKVLLSPERVIHRSSPPVYRTVYEKVLVHPGGERWEWRIIRQARLLPRRGAAALRQAGEEGSRPPRTPMDRSRFCPLWCHPRDRGRAARKRQEVSCPGPLPHGEGTRAGRPGAAHCPPCARRRRDPDPQCEGPRGHGGLAAGSSERLLLTRRQP